MHRLRSLAEALHPVLARIGPVPPERVATADALGLVLARPVVAPRPAPEVNVALRAGLAVQALEVVGASPQSPVFMAQALVRVRLGEALPAGCDAVLAPESGVDAGAFFEITQGAAPGEAVRLAGQDLARGATIADAGAVVTPSLRLVLQLAGVEELDVVRPRVSIAVGSAPAAAWLAATLAGLGCDLAASPEPHLVLAWTEDGEPRLALNPGETAWVDCPPGGPVEIGLPPRFDGLVAAFTALVLPVLARLTGRVAPSIEQPLLRKVASAVGSSDVALLKTLHGAYLPLSVGEITLASLAAADAVALLPPDSEGLPAGAALAATPLMPGTLS